MKIQQHSERKNRELKKHYAYIKYNGTFYLTFFFSFLIHYWFILPSRSLLYFLCEHFIKYQIMYLCFGYFVLVFFFFFFLLKFPNKKFLANTFGHTIYINMDICIVNAQPNIFSYRCVLRAHYLKLLSHLNYEIIVNATCNNFFPFFFFFQVRIVLRTRKGQCRMLCLLLLNTWKTFCRTGDFI